MKRNAQGKNPQSATRPERKRSIEEMAADLPRLDGCLSSRVVQAQAERWAVSRGANDRRSLGTICVRVEMEVYDNDGGCFIKVRRSRHPGLALYPDEIQLDDGNIRPDEIELFSLALAETVRLGKERGVFSGGGK